MNTLEPPRKSPAKRLILAAGGAVFGYGGMALFMASGLGQTIAGLGPGPVVLAGSGLIYFLMAVMVGIGAMIPSLGSRYLNVADRADLADQRGELMARAAIFVALGTMQVVLAFAGPEGKIGAAIVMPIVGMLATAAIGLSVFCGGYNDEMLRQLSWEAGTFAFIALFAVLTGWAAGVLFFQIGPIDPHALLAAPFLSVLAGCFWAAGRRSLLRPV